MVIFGHFSPIEKGIIKHLRTCFLMPPSARSCPRPSNFGLRIYPPSQLGQGCQGQLGNPLFVSLVYPSAVALAKADFVVARVGFVTTPSRPCHGFVTAEFEKTPSKTVFVTTSRLRREGTPPSPSPSSCSFSCSSSSSGFPLRALRGPCVRHWHRHVPGQA